MTDENYIGPVTVSGDRLVRLIQIGNRLAEENEGGTLADEWFKANATLASTTPDTAKLVEALALLREVRPTIGSDDLHGRVEAFLAGFE